ncbi:MAG: MBL fold metallo-hydrolase [Gemmatimonadales bacterium]|nr:MBL fold metallo-hydrolase [Gemmatimonadales bacterium]
MRFALGRAVVTVVNVGDISFDLRGYLNIPETELRARLELQCIVAQRTIPIQCVHIQLPEVSVLIDAGLYDFPPESEYFLAGYSPPAGLPTRLAELGISIEEVEHVVITHGHWDHFNGATHFVDGEHRAQFPRARHYLGRPDWDRAGAKLRDPQSLESRTLGVLHQAGALVLVEGDLALGHGVTIRAAPGETPGHQVVRIHSDGQTLYCLGDLYHHPIEFKEPWWMVAWAEPASIGVTRRAIMAEAVADAALVINTHIPGVGRLDAVSEGVEWGAAQLPPAPVLRVHS